MFNIRQAYEQDLHHIADMDIKSFDEPWPTELWTQLLLLDRHQYRVATSYGTPVGFVVFAPMTLTNRADYAREDPAKSVVIGKLAVKPAYRRRYIGSMLLQSVGAYCRDFDFTRVETLIPESLCVPGPRRVSGWMTKMGFRADRVVKNTFYNYGEIEDGYEFYYDLRTKTNE